MKRERPLLAGNMLACGIKRMLFISEAVTALLKRGSRVKGKGEGSRVRVKGKKLRVRVKDKIEGNTMGSKGRGKINKFPLPKRARLILTPQSLAKG